MFTRRTTREIGATVFKISNRFGAASVIALASAAAVVVPATASSAATTAHAFASMTTAPASPAATKPAVKILRTGFSPTAISAVPKKFTTCTQARSDMKIINRTSRPKTLTYQGSVFGTLPAHTIGFVCQFGPAGFQFVYGLQRSSSTLTVTMS
jgi:hypothetical protein